MREVFEETGIVAVLGDELASSEYRDARDRPKIVRYWSMPVAASVGFEPNDEISALAWVSMGEAADVLSYDRDRPVLASFISRSHAGQPNG